MRINVSKERAVDAAFAYYRKHGFLYPNLPLHERIRIFAELQEATSKINKAQLPTLLYDTPVNTIEIKRIPGQLLCNHYHRHIYASHAVNMRSAIASFAIDKSLRKAIVLSQTHSHIIDDKRVLQYLKVVNGTQICSNFRPSAAKAIYEYLPGNDVLDMSAGYGGRLVGFLASNLKGTYTRVDPQPETIRSSRRIVNDFGAKRFARLIKNAFEDVPQQTLPKVDIAFTSPPYFSKEIYDDTPTKKVQSRERYPNYTDWLKYFLRPMILKSILCLRRTGTLAINIADIKVKTHTYPLVNDTIKLAAQAQYKLVGRLEIVFGGFGKGNDKIKTEPVLLFRKP